MDASPEPAANEFFFIIIISNKSALDLADFQATGREGVNILPLSPPISY